MCVDVTIELTDDERAAVLAVVLEAALADPAAELLFRAAGKLAAPASTAALNSADRECRARKGVE